ncbi:hypothetical protein NIES2104_52240 [Leptolyngbya sp. NIES-2104]|nr:hypothetical protein NIES2104_52240 [Leptolyngbya sp. NIES-2104]
MCSTRSVAFCRILLELSDRPVPESSELTCFYLWVSQAISIEGILEFAIGLSSEP